MSDTSKTLLNNKSDFNNFINYLEDCRREIGYCYDNAKIPNSYPCVAVLWYGEDSAPYHEFEFVYPSDLYPMLQ